MNDDYFLIYTVVGIDLIHVVDDMGFTEEVLCSKNVYRYNAKTERDAVMFRLGVESLATAKVCDAVKVYIVDNTPLADIEHLEPVEDAYVPDNFNRNGFFNQYPFGELDGC